MNKIKYQDFIGFTFDNIHSSELGLYRTSGGSRFIENLTPTFKDRTVSVGGRDGTYLFGSDYERIEFSIDVAFDNVSEDDFRKIQNWGADKKVHRLIFDERPYKYYNVKLAAPPQLKYICFDESENFNSREQGDLDRRRRIYKGEGAFRFTCYEPFARSTILSNSEAVGSEVKFIKAIINKNLDQPFEIPIKSLAGAEEVRIYLSRDWLYDRGSWGAPKSGEFDPYTQEPTSSYYIHQPQRIKVLRSSDGTILNPETNYQYHLFPITFEREYYSEIDTKSVNTNGELVDGSFYNSSLYDSHDLQKRTEVMQYDPCLKVTFDKSSSPQETEDRWEEYGCYVVRLNSDGEYKAEPLKVISKPLANWVNGELTPINSTEVNQEVVNLEDLIGKENTLPFPDRNRIYIVRNGDNTLLSTQTNSLYFLPNSKMLNYFVECKYIKNGKENLIKIEVNLVNEDELPEGQQEGYYIEYYKNKFHNFVEWKNTINLPDKRSEWTENGENMSYEIGNPGDLSFPFRIYLPRVFDLNEGTYKICGGSLMFEHDNDRKLEFGEFALLSDEEVGICIDTHLRLIRGFYYDKKDGKTILTNNIYDKFITKGDYFTIPVGGGTLYLDYKHTTVYTNQSSITTQYPPIIEYEYLYI